MMTTNSRLYPNFTILVHLASRVAKQNWICSTTIVETTTFFCPNSSRFKCVDVGKKFSTRLVVIIGKIYFTITIMLLESICMKYTRNCGLSYIYRHKVLFLSHIFK